MSPPKSTQQVADEIATTAPTEISIPPVAITKVIPKARMISDEAR